MPQLIILGGERLNWGGGYERDPRIATLRGLLNEVGEGANANSSKKKP
jgi:hypothetical protein